MLLNVPVNLTIEGYKIELPKSVPIDNRAFAIGGGIGIGTNVGARGVGIGIGTNVGARAGISVIARLRAAIRECTQSCDRQGMICYDVANKESSPSGHQYFCRQNVPQDQMKC